jgi:hypothetical protein
MAIKKVTGAKKPVAKTTTKAKPKTSVTKSRGSKSATQVGNDNQRELYNLYRGMKEGGTYGKNAKYPGFTINKPLLAKDKISKAETVSKKSKSGGPQKFGGNEALAARNMQRAGGKTVTKKVQPAKPRASRGR